MIAVGKRRQNKGRRDRWGKEKYFKKLFHKNLI